MNKDTVNAANDDLLNLAGDAGNESTTDCDHHNYHPRKNPSNDSTGNNSNDNSYPALEQSVVLEEHEHLLPTKPIQIANSSGMSRAETTGAADRASPSNGIVVVPQKLDVAEPDPRIGRDATPIVNVNTLTAVEVAKTITAKTMSTVPMRDKKKQRAKPGFGLRTSRTTIVETGQKRRSCICTNSKKCNQLMTKWAKVSPSDYHFLQLPKEHIPQPLTELLAIETEAQHTARHTIRKMKTTCTDTENSTTLQGSHNDDNQLRERERTSNSNMSSTDLYKNGFRAATLRHISAKNPIPKDERIALCHYHPEVRPYLFWPKNTPSAQKYAIPIALAIKLGYDIEDAKCLGLNMEKYCYVLPTYDFEDAEREIGSIQKVFYDRVEQIQTNPAQFVRDLRQLEEDLQEVHKLRKRNIELLRKLDDRRRSIKRLRSVLKVQHRHSVTKEALQHEEHQQRHHQHLHSNQQTQQSFSASQLTNAPIEVGPSDDNNGGHQLQHQQQYQQHSYPTGGATSYHQQQHQIMDSTQQQQQQQQPTPMPQPLGLQNQNQQQQHNQFFQPTPPTQEQQTIGIVTGGINQNNEQQQQHSHHHHWAFNQQYQATPLGGTSGSDNEQQQLPQQQLQPPSVHAYDPEPNHDSQQQHQNQQQPVPSPMEEANNPENGYSTYANHLEAAMAAAVAVGFKDDQEGLVAGVEDDPNHHHQQQQQPNHHSHPPPHNIVVGDIVAVDDLVDYNNNTNLDSRFGGEISDDEDLKDDDCSDTERYRQTLGGPSSQIYQRPRKWPRRKVVVNPLPGNRATNDTNKLTRKSGVKRSGSKNSKSNTCTGRTIGSIRKKAKPIDLSERVT